MILRSLLFVPADSEKKLAKARSSPADALILDLEDSVAAENRAGARASSPAIFLKETHSQAIWVRVNPHTSADYVADLEAIVPARPAGLVIPKPDARQTIDAIDNDLVASEHANGVAARRHQAHPGRHRNAGGRASRW